MGPESQNRMRFLKWVIPHVRYAHPTALRGPEWIFERKYDCIRLLAFRNGRAVRLFSRNQLPQNYPFIADVIGALPVHQLILDGEVDWGDHKPDYHVFDRT